MDPSQTSFFQLCRTRTKMVGPGVSEVVSYLAAIALADGASVFIVSSTGAVTMRPTGLVPLVSPAILSAVAFNSEEPIEDLLFPDVGSTSDVYSNLAFSFNQQSVASTEGSRMVKVMVCGVRVVIPSAQRDRAHVPAPGSSVAVDPTVDSADWSEVFVIADEGAFLDMAHTEFSGHLIRMIIAHVDDMLLADDNGGVLSSDCAGRHETCWEGGREGGGVCLCDKTRPSLWRLAASLPVCLEPELDKRGLSMRSVGCKGNNQRPWCPITSFSNFSLLEGSVGNWSGARPRSSKWYKLVYKDSSFSLPRQPWTRKDQSVSGG